MESKSLTKDLKRVAAHEVTLAPGTRSSRPHAESLEEEFVYILEGTPHAWINGWLYELRAGHAVGFPAGTGITHTFINNSQKPVRMLVVGEKTKNDNLCAFPYNPEEKDHPIWWDNPPPQKLGPHRGEPGPTKPEDFAKEPSPWIVHAPSITDRKSFAYPGDSLTGSDYARLTEYVGLKYFGIGHEYLRPGHMSSYPHTHTHEEEFIYILKGNPELWLDGHRIPMKPGDSAEFVPMSGVAHVLMNESEENIEFIVVGETTKWPDEKNTYPAHPVRENEFKRKGYFWENAPRAKNYGTSPGWPKRKVKGHVRIRYPYSDQEVLEIFENSKTYFQRINGADPTLATVRTEKTDGPENGGPSWFKEFFVIEIEGEPAGVLDLHNDHPEPGTTFLGLLLLREDRFGKGFGKTAYQVAESYAKRAYGAKKIRIGISDDNKVAGFWEKMGFKPTGQTFEWKGEKKSSTVHVYDKHI